MKTYFFLSTGLRFDVDHLNKMKSKIHLLEIDAMAEYVDGICYRHVLAGNDVPGAGEMFQPHSNWNVTSIGNMAFIALNHPNAATRAFAVDWINQFKAYRKSQGL